MNIVMVSSEVISFAKTGGLADMVTGLAKALDRAGHQVTIIMPHYRRFVPRLLVGTGTGRSVSVDFGDHVAQAWVRRSRIPETRVNVLLIDHPGYFDRAGLYGHAGTDFPDNAERFLFLNRAAMETCVAFGLEPDIVHVHDWQAAFVPVLLKERYRDHPVFRRTGTVLTLHNLAFQGMFGAEAMSLTGLPFDLFRWDRLEFWGHLNLLKSGCVYADRLTTVSPTYAREITTPQFGCGLEGVLAARGSDLRGILNGVDVDDWNPARDKHLPQTYDRESVERGKAINKRELQRELSLHMEDSVPFCGLVSRLTEQKGLNLIEQTADQLLATDAQLVFLGGGDRRFENVVKGLAMRAKGRVACSIGYNEPLAHRIEAGADLFLMPSRFEPCGLNQMYSLMYGTLPLVHSVGGLADSVTNLTEENLDAGRANGFVFYDYTSEAFIGTFRWALATYRDRDTWTRLQQAAMSLDLSWSRSAQEYVDVYADAQQAALAGRMPA